MGHTPKQNHLIVTGYNYNGLNFNRFYHDSSHSHSNNVALMSCQNPPVSPHRGEPHWQIDNVSTKSIIFRKSRRDGNSCFCPAKTVSENRSINV